MKKKVLYIKWNSYLKDEVESTIKKFFENADVIEIKVDGYKISEDYKNSISRKIDNEIIDYVFTLNYIPEVSNICEQKSIKYISWIYDAPCAMLYDKSVRNKCNYIYTFDGNVVSDLSNKGIKNIQYLPLATTKEFTLEYDDVNIKYNYDISFVGSTYEKMLGIYNQCMGAFPSYIKGYLTAVIDSQVLLDGNYILEDVIDAEIEDNIKKILNLDLGDGYLMSYKSFFANYVLGAKTTAIQRERTLNKLSDYFNVDLFTGDLNSQTISNKISVHKPVEYGKNLARIYRNSKINLNITMNNIQQGIPLRVFDIMGSGGFVMTNYRPGIEEHFTDGIDLVIYYDMNDMLNKAEYYLAHDAERIKIAKSGREKVTSHYMVENQIEKIFLSVV